MKGLDPIGQKLEEMLQNAKGNAHIYIHPWRVQTHACMRTEQGFER